MLCKHYLDALSKVYEQDGATILMRKSYQSAYQTLAEKKVTKEKEKEESKEEEKTSEHVNKPVATDNALAVPDAGEKPLNPSPTWSQKDEEEDPDAFDLGGLFNEVDA